MAVNCFPTDSAGFRRNSFDFLRFVLAVVVIYSHSYLVLHGSNEWELLGRLSRAKMDAGDVGVNSFFLISGFLIAHSWLNSDGFWSFLKKRALRIYPAFLVAMLLCGLIVAPLASDGSASPFSPRQLVRWGAQAVTLQQYGAPGMFVSNPVPMKVNGPMWSIRYEWWCYMAVGLAGTLSLLTRPRVVLTLFVVALSLSFAQSRVEFIPGAGTLERYFGEPAIWPRFASYFLAGVLFYLWRGRIPRSKVLASIALGVVLLSYAFPVLLPITMPTCWAYVLFFVAYCGITPLERWGRWGDFSYGLYLYAFPIQQLLVMWSRERFSPLGLFVLVTGLTLPMAVVSWYLVERPCLRLKKPKATAAGLVEHKPTVASLVVEATACSTNP
jgi:peptidoglycan/LPS O-acetylase OafA/YrhL